MDFPGTFILELDPTENGDATLQAWADAGACVFETRSRVLINRGPADERVYAFVGPRDGLSDEQFRAEWNGRHADLLLAADSFAGQLDHYAQHNIVRRTGQISPRYAAAVSAVGIATIAASGFDGLSAAFADSSYLERFLTVVNREGFPTG